MKLDSILRYIALTGLFAILFIPFMVSGSMFFPFITGKNFAFRIITEISLGAWAILALRNKDYRPKFSWIFVAILSFVGITLVANIAGVNTHKSLWSNFERMEGWFTLLHLLGYFFLASSMLNTKKLWERFFKTSMWVSVALGVYGIFQLLGFITINQGAVRIDTTFGNASYFAIFMVFNAFFTSWFLLQRSLALRERGDSIIKDWRSLMYFAILGLQLFSLYFTATRGSILGLIGGAILTLVLIALFEKEHGWLRKISWIKVGVLVLLIVTFIAVKDTDVVRDNKVLGRFSRISLESSTTKARFLVWGMAWESFLENPILGTGQENFNYIFNSKYHPQMFGQEQWFDRAHNVVLDWLTASGILGFLAYMSMFGTTLYYIWKRDEDDDISVSERALFTGLLSAYFFHNFFVFDNIISYVFFVSILAMFHMRKSRPFKVTEIKSQDSSDWAAVVGSPVVVILTVFSVYFFNIPNILQAQTLIEALRVQRQDPVAALGIWQEAIDFGASGTQEVREQLIQGAAGLAGVQDIELRQQYFSFAEREILHQAELDPNNARLFVFMGSFYGRYRQYDKAIDALTRAMELSPNKQSIMFELGQNHLNAGNYPEAFEVISEAYNLAPDFEEARLIYATAAIYVGQQEIVDEIFLEDYGTTNPTHDQVIRAYAFTEQYDRVLDIWLRKVEAQPDNPQNRLSLAATYRELGNIEEAVNQIEKVVEIEPNFRSQADQIIQEMRSGN